MRGLALALPGFNALQPEWLGDGAGRPRRHAIPALGRRSGRIPADPYPPPRRSQYKPDARSREKMIAGGAAGGL